MNDAGGVCVSEAVAELFHPCQPALQGRRRLATQQIPDGGAVDVLHRDEQVPVDLADVVHRDDVGMSQVGDRPRFAEKPFAKLAVLTKVGFEDLDRDGPVELRVAGEIDRRHPAEADSAFDLVAADTSG